MSRLALYLFGTPRVERDGIPITVDTRKAIALIAYLAITRQKHSRDALATLLWPDYDQPNARAALRRTLSTLNKALAGEWLVIERETIGLDFHADLQIDVVDFSRALAECRAHGHSMSEICPACVDPLSRAVALYTDDFLAGFNLRDSSNFDDWQFFQADSLRRELAGALERLMHCYSALGDFPTAISHARRWLALDRLHEPAHRHLMQLYAWAGQRSSALHQYRECVQVLDQELGVSPLEETTQLYQAIKENRPLPPPVPFPPSQNAQGIAGTTLAVASKSAPPEDVVGATLGVTLKSTPSIKLTLDSLPPPPPQPPLAVSSYPLVGRAREWATMVGAYDAIETVGALLILEGEAGIGKTRLAAEFLNYAQAKGASVIAARCYEGEAHLAYEPLISGLRAALSKKDASWLETLPVSWLSEVTRLLPELASARPGLPPTLPLDTPGAQSRFFEGLRQLLLALCSGNAHQTSTPGVLFFDDVQWADGASLDLLTYLARRLPEQPLCLLITCRNNQVAGQPRLQRLLTESQRAGTGRAISLQRLSRSTVQELVQAVTASGTPLPREFAERLYTETEGLPFFLVEYLAAMSKDVPTSAHEQWSLPGGVRDLLHSRLMNVSETGWQLLNTAAVIGRSFDFDTLREASGRSEEETVTALEELMAKDLVEEVRGGSQAMDETMPSYDFCHEKLRTLVYEETSLARRRLLHRRIAEVMVNRTRGMRNIDSLAGQIAQHYQLAGNEQTAAQYFKLAGEHARTLYAHAEALAHFRMALALGHPESAALHEAIGDLQVLLGEYSAALKSYETAASLSDAAHLALLDYKLGSVYQRRGEWEQAESHFEVALHSAGEDNSAGERARIYADLSLIAHHREQLDRAQQCAFQSLKLAEFARDRRALAQAHNILGILASSTGDFALAYQHLQQSLALAEELNDPAARVAALNNLALAYRASGNLERALELTQSALALCVYQGDRHREAALHSNLADLLHALGRSEEAMSHLKQSVSIYAEIGAEAGTLQPEIWKLVEW